MHDLFQYCLVNIQKFFSVVLMNYVGRLINTFCCDGIKKCSYLTYIVCLRGPSSYAGTCGISNNERTCAGEVEIVVAADPR